MAERIITPDRAAIAELREEGFEVADPFEDEARRVAFVAELMRLHRITAAPLCGMTSRSTPWTTRRPIQYSGDVPEVEVVTRFGSYELALEAGLWAAWLIRAISIQRQDRRGGFVPVPLDELTTRYPTPPPRPFRAPTWPHLGSAPPASSRRPRARRS